MGRRVGWHWRTMVGLNRQHGCVAVLHELQQCPLPFGGCRGCLGECAKQAHGTGLWRWACKGYQPSLLQQPTEKVGSAYPHPTLPNLQVPKALKGKLVVGATYAELALKLAQWEAKDLVRLGCKGVRGWS